ncbi:MAG: hypothetical protein WHU95_03765 [candidate division WOR-3 bacterium]|jgi:hypothetical protein|nr:hypothetical protein [candidate division WOR-3 bacterium]MDH7518797.1 hypothetical protein [bacterium]
MTFHIYLEGTPVYRVNIIAEKIVDEGANYALYDEKGVKVAEFKKEKVLGYDVSEY